MTFRNSPRPFGHWATYESEKNPVEQRLGTGAKAVTMILDLGKPAIVIAGAWNPAIFQPTWVLTNLFGAAVGETHEVTEVLNELEQKRITYKKNVGIHVNRTRLELLTTGIEAAEIDLLTSVTREIFGKLPHTPIVAIGVNFAFAEMDDPQQHAPKFEIADKLDEDFQIIETQISRKIVLDDLELNFRRVLAETVAGFEFNFHHSGTSLGKAKAITSAYWFELLEIAKGVLKSRFGVEELSVHNPFGAQQEDTGGAI